MIRERDEIPTSGSGGRRWPVVVVDRAACERETRERERGGGELKRGREITQESERGQTYERRGTEPDRRSERER